MVDLGEGEWLDANRARWNELVPIHVASDFYDQSALRAGRGVLVGIERDELPALFPDGLDGKRILHLQCHFGADSLVLAQQGATVVGVDFSHAAIVEARALAAEVGLGDRARFIEANIYDLRHTLPEPESFDLVFTTWGTIGWLPDVAEWARIVAWFLKPGGRFYFADGHPAALVFAVEPDLTPRFSFAYYSDGEVDVTDESADYADGDATIGNARSFEWSHPVSEIVSAILDAGMTLDFLHESYEAPWKLFDALEPVGNGTWAWPDRKWLPLALSLAATR